MSDLAVRLLKAVQKIDNEIISLSRMDDAQVFTFILKEIQAATGFDRVAIGLLTEGGNIDYLALHNGELKKGWQLEKGKGVTSQVVTTKQAVFVPDVSMNNEYERTVLVGSPIKNEFVAPLSTNGSMLGVLDLGRLVETPPLLGEDQELLSIFAAQIGTAVQNIRLNRRNSKLVERLDVINTVGQEINSVLNVRTLTEQVNRRIKEVFKPDVVTIAIFNQDNLTAHLRGFDKDVQIDIPDDPIGDLTKLVADNCDSLLIQDVTKETPPAKPTEVLTSVQGEIVSFIFAPLCLSGRSLGVITVQSYVPNTFDKDDKKALSTIAGHAAVAISNAQSFEQKIRELEALSGIDVKIVSAASAAELDELLNHISEKAVELTKADLCSIALYNDKENIVKQINPTAQVSTPIIDKRSDSSSVKSQNYVRIEIQISSFRQGTFDHNHERLLSALIKQAVVAIEYVEQQLEKKAANERLAAVAEINQELSFTPDWELQLQIIWDLILGKALNLLGAIYGNLMLKDRVKGDLYTAAQHGKARTQTRQMIGMDKGIVPYVFLTRRTLNVGDVSNPPDGVTYTPMIDADIKSELATPLRVRGSEKVLGVLNVESERLNAFTRLDEKLLETFADQVSIALQIVQQREREFELRGLAGMGGEEFIHEVHTLVGNVFLLSWHMGKVKDETEQITSGILEINSSTLASKIEGLDKHVDKTVAAAGTLKQILLERNNALRDTSQKRNISVYEIFERTQSDYGEPIPENIQVEIESYDEKLTVFASEGVFSSFQNIFNNAVKEIRKLGRGGYIRLGAESTSLDDVMFWISDNGPGIPAATQAVLFNAFKDAQDSATSGMGIGLWIAKLHIILNNGEIDMHTEESVGTTFRICLPRGS